MFYKDSRQVCRVPELDALGWLIHGFGTRHAKVPAMFANLATLKQTHSSECVAAGGRSGVLGCGDALLENTPGAVVAVRTADCVPLLLVDERLRAVAAVHAGWRGTVARIAERAVEAMRGRFGSHPADLHAAIGPAIGPCCYEVGPEVAAQFGGRGRGPVDLPAANRRQFLDAGVTPERIYASNLCTMCLSDDFHSFRRDGQAAGRMYSFAGVGQAMVSGGLPPGEANALPKILTPASEFPGEFGAHTGRFLAKRPASNRRTVSITPLR